MGAVILSAFVLLVVQGAGTLAAEPDAAAGANSGDGNAQLVEVSTLHWPPYTGRDLPDGGAATSVLRAAFAAQGYDVKVHFWPWNRAIAKARSDDSIAAYFPGYHCRHDDKATYLPSDPMGAAPLGFAEHAQAPQSWETLDDLVDKRVGTVVGYANTEEFDARVEAGEQRVITSSDDVANLSRLAKQEIHLAVIDRFVMQYLISTEKELEPHSDVLAFNDTLLAETDLFLCFLENDKGERLRAVFNQGLERIDAERILDDYVTRLVGG